MRLLSFGVIMACAVAAFVLAPAAAQAPRPATSEPRSALVIGNGAYPDAPLPGAIADARAVAAALRQAGFEVRASFDLNERDLRAGIASFKQQLRPGAVGLIYFAGRGIQIARRNYLLPIDAKTETLRDLLATGLDANALLAERLAPSVDGVFVLDAARENPFEQRLRGFSAGLAMLEAAPGWFVALPAEPGRTTLDRAGAPGLYARELSASLSPGVGIQTLFDQVRAAVSRATNGQQIPWTFSTLQRPLALVPGPAAATSPGPAAGTPQAQPQAPSTLPAGAARPGAVLRDCPDCPELVAVPAGSFEMGSNEFYERPRHRVTIAQPFAIGRREVTFDEWDRCVDEQGCKYRPPDRGWGRASRPVTNVSWLDAMEFVEWLSAKTGKKYRLPSEAEWEYAARAGSQTPFWWGQEARDLP